MQLKFFLREKPGIIIELLLFFIICISTLPVGILVPLLIVISIGSMKIRDITYSEIGLIWTDFKLINIVTGVGVAFSYFILFHYLIDPAISKIASGRLPAAFEIKGDINKLLKWLLVSWTVAAIGEEIIFRGYLVNRLTELTGQSTAGKFLIIFLSAIAFGMAHFYQGFHGVLSAGLIGIFQAIIYLSSSRKLVVPVIAHGSYDTIGFLLLFAGV